MEYYIYVSDTKVDMLYDQIPARLRDKLATELKIDLKLLSTTFSEQPTEESRFSKLGLVTDYIEKHEPVGTVDSPASYFKGIMQMRWGPYGFKERNTIYFAGTTDYTVLGLGGSLKHVIGGNKGVSPTDSSSLTPILLAVLAKELQLPLYRPHDMVVDFTQDDISALHAVFTATMEMSGPKQRLKFLAKRLLDSNDYPERNEWGWLSHNKHVLLGTPLYVALAD